jgi:hypothetical protein
MTLQEEPQLSPSDRASLSLLQKFQADEGLDVACKTALENDLQGSHPPNLSAYRIYISKAFADDQS